MAKSEGKLKKQRKGKKRQHDENANGSDDEVATKSLIVEGNNADAGGEVVKKSKEGKGKKRKVPNNKEETANKRSKHVDSDAAEQSDEQVDGDADLPTIEQIRESEKPENVNAIVTVRQKKKQKHQKRLEAQKEQNTDKEQKRNDEYLRKWKEARGDWKFEKLRQISIQQTIFDESKISNELWPIALEYLSGSKGAAKEKITKLADEVIEQLDKEAEAATENESDVRQAIVESVRYQRARALLQSFD